MKASVMVTMKTLWMIVDWFLAIACHLLMLPLASPLEGGFSQYLVLNWFTIKSGY